MNSPPDKWIEAISTLNELTQIGQLTWTIDSRSGPSPRPPSSGGLARAAGLEASQYTLLGVPYLANYGGKTLRLSRFVAPDKGVGLLAIGGGANVYVLDILNNDGIEIYRVPASSGLNDLFRSIEHQASGVDELLSDLLAQGQRLKQKQK